MFCVRYQKNFNFFWGVELKNVFCTLLNTLYIMQIFWDSYRLFL